MTATHNFDLIRPQETRDRHPARIVEFDLVEIKQHFDENLENINSHFSLSDQLMQNNSFEAAKDIWRLQIIFLDSALDFYIHEMTKYGMNKIFNGEWPETDKFKNYTLRIPVVMQALKNPEDVSWFLENVNQTYAKAPLMSFESINAQFNLIGIKKNDVANTAFYVAGSNEKTLPQLKKALEDLFERRNAIAHQSDRYHHDATRKDIDKAYVVQAIENIRKIVGAIDTCILDKNTFA